MIEGGGGIRRINCNGKIQLKFFGSLKIKKSNLALIYNPIKLNVFHVFMVGDGLDLEIQERFRWV